MSSDLRKLIINEPDLDGFDLEKATIVPLSHSGVNSNIHIVNTNDRRLILKKFRTLSDGERSRYDAENFALDFFEKYNIRFVPQKVFSSRKSNFILMTFIEGVKPDVFSSQIANQAIEFLHMIHTASLDLNLSNPIYATEAFLSAKELYQQIDNRIDNFYTNIPDQSPIISFLRYQLEPFYKRLRGITSGKILDQKIDISHMTFSVVDFGLNNYILDKDNLLNFIDFEFSGMDDPVKLVSDTLFHPANNLSVEDIKKYQPLFCKIFQDTDPSFESRFESFYLFFGVKWCLIMLKHFLRSKKVEIYENDDLMQLRRTKERLSILEELC
ncbi:hypothetical protein OAM47_00790 [Gammaproteobacteria bacterium]|nr:hypothetical protein [Gammaproteobacteria bacterium]